MMSKVWLLAITSVLVSYAGGSVKRANYWQEILSVHAVKAGNPPLTAVRSLPGKGCGLSFGETAWGWTTFDDVPVRILICRNRSGVRLDITTYEKHWIRGPKDKP